MREAASIPAEPVIEADPEQETRITELETEVAGLTKENTALKDIRSELEGGMTKLVEQKSELQQQLKEA